MADIKHLLHIAAPREKVYQALSTIEGLSNWWTRQTTGSTRPGDVVQFRFGEFGNDMKVEASEPGKLVKWKCVAGPEDWIGTSILFGLDENEGKTRIRFEHANWAKADDFFAACSFTWSRYLESLRQFCQTGKGEAFGSEHYRK